MSTAADLPQTLAIALMLALLASNVSAQGIIIDREGRAAEVTLVEHDVDAIIEENVAVVTVEHIFRNNGSTAAEGSFLFPLPPGAQISRFSMEVDGRELAGELLSAEEARRIYEEIVRRSLDPALLEMVGHRSFRASVFPIPPGERRTIRLRYDAVLPKDGSITSFQYPLQGSLQTNRTARAIPLEQPSGPNSEDGSAGEGAVTSIHIEMSSASPVVTVYSPSHSVETERPHDRRAVVRHRTPVGDDRDFVVYFGMDEQDVGATLLTHRPYGDRPGYFMLLLSPGTTAESARVQPKDVVFVLDTSGSMAGEKIDQAREALRYCLRRLGENDRFGVVAFSSDVDRFRNDLSTIRSRDDALYFADQLEAGGGTNIHAALLNAADLISESDRGLIIFLTDGLPSVGVEDEGQIRRDVREALRDRARIFTFGVGYDVNTHLLDGLSRDTGVPAEYISPDENIEEKVSAFYDKISHPLLTDLSFELSGADAYAYAPRQLHDLYRGGQLIIAGRYRRPGPAELALSGSRDGRSERFTYTLNFPEHERDKEFVARLWATRRVGQLLEEIRLNGENAELKGEIVSLAKEFGLVTPYTSYLVQEEDAMADNVLLRPHFGSRGVDEAADMMVRGADAFKTQSSSGAGAVAASRAIRAMASAEAAPVHRRVTSVKGRTMILRSGGGWVDSEFGENDSVVSIKMASDAYFALLRTYPEALPFARLSEKITFRIGGRYVRIGDTGLESATEAELRALIG